MVQHSPTSPYMNNDPDRKTSARLTDAIQKIASAMHDVAIINKEGANEIIQELSEIVMKFDTLNQHLSSLDGTLLTNSSKLEKALEETIQKSIKEVAGEKLDEMARLNKLMAAKVRVMASQLREAGIEPVPIFTPGEEKSVDQITKETEIIMADVEEAGEARLRAQDTLADIEASRAGDAEEAGTEEQPQV